MNNSITALVRVDSGEHIGTGHVMRCLTLAKLLRARGISIYFISKPHKGHCLDEIRRADFKVIELPTSNAQEYAGNWCPHAHWLGGTESNDARESLAALHHTTLNERVIVVVDHFSLTSQWHIALKEALNAKVVVIDGLADRTLKCDVLIDPNLVLDAQKKWDGKIQNNTKLMIGPQYFPLREEFAFSPPTLPQALKRIFVCFGGMDKDNATLFICELLAKWCTSLDEPVSVDVIIGEHHPFKPLIHAFCNQHGFKLHVQASNVSLLMAQADLAIGGGGTMSWERCKMALPTLVLAIAQNQVAQAIALEEKGAAVYVGDYSTESKRLEKIQQRVVNVLENLRCSPDTLKTMSQSALSIMEAYNHNQPWVDEIIKQRQDVLKKVVIIGGGGNGLVVAQIVLDLIKIGEPLELVGFLNDNIPAGEYIERWPVLGAPHEWESLDEDTLFVYALLSVGKMKARAEKFKRLNIPQHRLATLVHPSANIGFNVKLGCGVVIAANTVLQPGTRVGDNCFIRANANLGHDVAVDDLVDIGPNSTLCGYAHIEEGVQIAPNSVVRDSVRVGMYSTVAAGAAIFKDVAPESTMLGNPAKRIR